MTHYDVEILDSKSVAAYDRFSHQCPHGLAQQSVEWSDVIAPISPDTPYFLVVRNTDNGEVLGGLPLYYFKGKFGGIMTSVPHAGPLGGVLLRPGLEEGIRKALYKVLLEKAIDLAKDLNCISLSIITNPFLQDEKIYHNVKKPDYILNNFTQIIELQNLFKLNGTYNTGKSRFNNFISKNLGKAKRAGVVVQWGEETDFEDWYEIHCKRHAELGAKPLPKELLMGILSVMDPAEMGGLAVTKINDKIVGGCLYIWDKDVADAFIMSGDSDYLYHGINHAVTDFALRDFQKRGIRFFNWQSCNRNSGVYDFKVKWGSKEIDYQVLTWTFPGFEKVFEVGAQKVADEYPWHYVAPFDAIANQCSHGVFSKG